MLVMSQHKVGTENSKLASFICCSKKNLAESRAISVQSTQLLSIRTAKAIAQVNIQGKSYQGLLGSILDGKKLLDDIFIIYGIVFSCSTYLIDIQIIFYRGSAWEFSHFCYGTETTHAASPVSGALQDSRPFCHFKSRLIHGHRVKEPKKLHQIPKKMTLPRQKNVTGS